MRHEAIDLVTRIENIVKNPGTSNRTVRVIVRTLEERSTNPIRRMRNDHKSVRHSKHLQGEAGKL